MYKQKLGSAGLEVSVLGLGCMGMSEFYGEHNDQQSLNTLQHAMELGVNFWDTSDMYGPHTNELLLGRAIRELGIQRDKLVLATKFGIVRDSETGARDVNGHPDYIRQACEASLKRLGVDYIDLYYQHRVDPRVPIEDTVGAMAELVKEGKVRYLGLSEAGVDTIRRACREHPISALQSEYSLWSRDIEQEIIPVCKEMGVGLVPYSPLGRGFLTGTINKREDLEKGDWRLLQPRFAEDNLKENVSLLDLIMAMAAEKNCTSAQLVLAWVLHQDVALAPIPGTRRVERLTENVGAIDIKLNEAELHRLSEGFASERISGERYPEDHLQFIKAS